MRLTRIAYRGALRIPHRRLRRPALALLALSTFLAAVAAGYLVAVS